MTGRKTRALKFFFLSTIALALIASIALMAFFRQSLPPKGKKLFFSGLEQPIAIHYDKAGVPTIETVDATSALFGQGWVTASERFFQMELIRRKMKGRLSEVFGPAALESDKEHRLYRSSEVAEAAYKNMPAHTKIQIEAYANGVNAFIERETLPWEIRVLGITPELWTPPDTFLVILSMFEALNFHDGFAEEAVTALRKKLGNRLAGFFTPEGGFLDTPILPENKKLIPVPPPTPNEFRVTSSEASYSPSIKDDIGETGSNAWAVAGSKTESGKPILASDPHLSLYVPNLWYRAFLKYGDHQIVGATLPGVPGIVIGTNLHVAWAFTNSMGDNTDWVELEKAGELSFKVNSRTEGQVFQLIKRIENIPVKGKPDAVVEFLDSPWGPVIHQTPTHFLALQWAALDSSALSSLDILTLNESKTLQKAWDALNTWAGPTQNAVVASLDGDIGWKLVGKIPNRIGFDGQSYSTRDQTHRWEGYQNPSTLPQLINPKTGLIVSANQRPLGEDQGLVKIGHDWPSAARAYRIHELLNQKVLWNPQNTFKVQTDTLSHTHLWYRDTWLSCHPSAPQNPWLSKAYALTKDWDGRLSRETTAYPVLWMFRKKTHTFLTEPIARSIDPQHLEALQDRLSSDFFIHRVLTLKSPNLLSPQHTDYCAFLDHSMEEAAKSLAKTPEELATIRWGEINRSEIHHPFTRILPTFLAGFLDMPQVALPGDHLVPNVTQPKKGASFRMVVDFGNLKNSLFHMPGGQSGHFLSANYRDSYKDWASETVTPLLPGSDINTNILLPAGLQ